MSRAGPGGPYLSTAHQVTESGTLFTCKDLGTKQPPPEDRALPALPSPQITSFTAGRDNPGRAGTHMILYLLKAEHGTKEVKAGRDSVTRNLNTIPQRRLSLRRSHD